MKNKMIQKLTAAASEYFLYFFAYSVIGWCYEVFLETVVYQWGFSNRGILFGPYCPVYGFGMLLFLSTVYRLIQDKPLKIRILMIPAVIIFCALIATAVELLTSYICEFFTGSWPWQTYADYSINFQARIALSPSIRFGLGGALFLYLVQPLFSHIAARLGSRKRLVVSTVLAAVMAVDFVITLLL